MSAYLDKVQAIAYALDSGIGTKEVLGDKNAISSQMQKMMWLQEDILSLNVNLPEDGELVTYMSNNYLQVKKAADDMNLQVYTSGLSSSTFFNDKNSNSMLLKVISPIHLSGKIGGTFEIVFILEDIEAAVQATIREYVKIAVCLSIAVLILIFLLIRWFVLVPVRELNAGVKSISDGNLNYKVKLKSKDEFGVLADSFNGMANEILISKNLLEKHQQELESQVADRTKELGRKVGTLEKLNKFMVRRELKMVELKKRIAELERDAARKNAQKERNKQKARDSKVEDKKEGDKKDV
ncbi:MAG: HAMP domain-containing protein [archaeon]